MGIPHITLSGIVSVLIVTVQVSDDGAYVTCLVAWVSNLGIIISIPQMYLDIPTEYRIDLLFD